MVYTWYCAHRTVHSGRVCIVASRRKSEEENNVPEALSNKELSTGRRFDDATLRGISSFEDAMRLAADTYGSVIGDADLELGNGFRVATDDDKARLVNVPFIILTYTFNDGDYGEFATMMVITSPNGDRLIVNDGSTGIFSQLLDIMKTTNRTGGIFIERGLRVSEYATCSECGKPRKPSEAQCGTCGDDSERRSKGRTFYLDVG